MRTGNLCRRLLVVLAVTFVLSAWLYCLATMHALRSVNDPHRAGSTAPLMGFFRDKGGPVLAGELVAIAICGALWVLAERWPSRSSRVIVKRADDDLGPPLGPSCGPHQHQPAAEYKDGEIGEAESQNGDLTLHP